MAGRPTGEPGQKMDVMLRIMLTADQRALIGEAAQQQWMDMSAWARPLLLQAARKQVAKSAPKRKKRK